MNADAHNTIMRSAFEALPVPLRRPLEAIRPLLGIVGNYPDLFDDPTRPDAAKDRDDPNWRRFCRFPATIGGTSQHYWPTPIFDQCGCRPMIEHLLRQAVDARRADDLDGFIKFVGCLSHYAGDVCQPIHTVDEDLIADLLPPPAAKPDFHYHRDLEAVTGECSALEPPRLLGLSIAEAAWRIGQANLQSIAACRPYVIPTLQALFADDQAEARRLAGPPVTRAAQSTLDVLYTALVLADPDEPNGDHQGEILGPVDLRRWRPDGERQSSAYGGSILDGSRATPPAGAPVVPAALRSADGAQDPVRGLGVMPTVGSDPHSAWMRYGLPAGVFDRFEATVGLHAGLTTRGAVEFVVELDGREAFRSGRLTASEAAAPVSVPLGRSAELVLKVVDANEGTTYFDNHAIWAEPVLRKGER